MGGFTGTPAWETSRGPAPARTALTWPAGHSPLTTRGSALLTLSPDRQLPALPGARAASYPSYRGYLTFDRGFTVSQPAREGTCANRPKLNMPRSRPRFPSLSPEEH